MKNSGLYKFTRLWDNLKTVFQSIDTTIYCHLVKYRLHYCSDLAIVGGSLNDDIDIWFTVTWYESLVKYRLQNSGDLAIVGGSLIHDIDTMSDTTKTIELQNTRMTNEFVTFILLYIFVRQLFHSSFSQRILFFLLLCGSLSDDTCVYTF